MIVSHPSPFRLENFILVWILSCAWIAPLLFAQLPNQPAAPAVLKIRVEGDMITAEIRNVPLQQVLSDLAARTGIVFEVGTHDNQPISVNLYRVTLAEAVDRVIGNSNALVYYARDAAGRNRIQLVRVFSGGAKPSQPSLIYLGTGEITKSNEDTIENAEQAIKALSESSKLEVRQKAVEVLVAAKTDVSIQAIARALADAAPEVRAAAIEGLASLGARGSLPQILQCLRDEHPGVRRSAITAVALLGDAENVKDLRRMSRDKDSSVAAEAEAALRKLAARHP
jgi:hypothetical protein